MFKQAIFSVAGEGATMRRAVDDADEQINEFIQLDDEPLNITCVAANSFCADGVFYHTITIYYCVLREEATGDAK